MIVKVKGIAYDISGSPIILLTDSTEQKVLPIWIGLLEVPSITLAMEGNPQAHDITLTICETLGAQLTGVEICQLKDNTYFAKLYLSTGKDEYLLDIRPSDAIALALRAELPIAISKSLQEQMLEIKELLDEDAQKALQQLSDEYFKKDKSTLH